MKYFNDHIDYPRVSGEIMPLDTLWQYISSTFLNGMINYQKPIRAFLVIRYREKGHQEKVETFNKTKKYHTDLKYFQDDVVVLSKNEQNEFWFYWFDCDVSDCMIGRFETEDSDEDVKQEFERYVQECANRCHDNGKIFELDVSKFTGWISF